MTLFSLYLKRIFYFAFAVLSLHSLSQCTKKEFATSRSSVLAFSTDTLSFDTVFTSFGSTTQYFKVYNQHSKHLKIDNVRLGKASSSSFSLNVNGYASDHVTDLEIAPNDSLFVFVEVTIDPNNSNNALIEKDSVIFESNGNAQNIKLEAYGQDVVLVDGKVLKTQTWTNKKPYLILNSALVDTLETLTIEAGATLHFGAESKLYVLGTLNAKGTQHDSIVFRTSRTDYTYHDVPGLWGGIWLLPGSVNNVMNHTIVQNAEIGIRADSLIAGKKPTLELHNSRIEHHTVAGLYAQGSRIVSTNSVFADCGYYAISLQIGGEYNFYHCTVANYWLYTNRTTPSVIVRNYYVDVNNILQLRPILAANFHNCVLYGNKQNELLLDLVPETDANFLFDHCLVRVAPESNYLDLSPFSTSIFNQQPLFQDIAKYNYRPSPQSPIIGAAATQTIQQLPTWLAKDIENNQRLTDNKADIGAYEYQPAKDEK